MGICQGSTRTYIHMYIQNFSQPRPRLHELFLVHIGTELLFTFQYILYMFVYTHTAAISKLESQCHLENDTGVTLFYRMYVVHIMNICIPTSLQTFNFYCMSNTGVNL